MTEPIATYSLSIKSSSGYRATTKGTCSPQQYGAAVAVLDGARTKLETELTLALRNLLDDTQHKHHDCGGGPCPVLAARAVLARALGTP